MKIRDTGSGNQPEKTNDSQNIIPKLVSRKSAEQPSVDRQQVKGEDKAITLSGISNEKLLKDEEKLMKLSLNKDKVNVGFVHSMILSLDGN